MPIFATLDIKRIIIDFTNYPTPTDRVYAIARDAEVNNFVEAVSTIDLILIDAEPGDVNKDGNITAADISMIVNIIAGISN